MATPPLEHEVAAAILDALPGIVYLVDGDGVIRWYNSPRWDAFASANGGDGLMDAANVLGRPLLAAIAGGEVRDSAIRLMAAVHRARDGQLRYTYRCDSPEAVRLMQMTLTSVRLPAGAPGVLYHSAEIEVTPRPAVGLLTRPSVEGRLEAEDIVSLCSYCRRVRWPSGSERWVEPGDYYREGGVEGVLISHGICPDCTRTLMEAMDAAA